MSIGKYSEENFKKSGAKGGVQKGINYKKRRIKLLARIEQETDVMTYNIMRSRLNNDELQKVINNWDELKNNGK